MDGGVLSRIESPADMKGLSADNRVTLSEELRREIIEVVSHNGGHLAPSLGAVDLTVAIHTVFDSPKDRIVWDVGHQAYAHKLLTGRREFFKTLRLDGGCSGFLSRAESEHDAFGAGHAGTAISAALGMAAARDHAGGNWRVVAVVGDGALNCGVALEGLNNVADISSDMTIILNDNKMSISPNVGGMARYLNRIISAKPYNRFKSTLRRLVRSIPKVGYNLTRRIARLEEAVKSVLVPGVIFEELGMRYVGPVDGHDMEEMIRVFEAAKEYTQRPTLIHVVTEKGRGYEPAEKAPEKFHGLSTFDPDTGEITGKKGGATFSEAFGGVMESLAVEREDVVAITAAMRSGTGLKAFAERFPERFHDVGIAEEHAVVMAAGMAVDGIRPIVAIYASFLQRALDYVFHDVCLQNLPVVICCDRAGVVDDGPTHHGIHDLAFLMNLPNLSIICPRDAVSLEAALRMALNRGTPVVVRYPRGDASDIPRRRGRRKSSWGAAEILRDGSDLAIWAAGRECATALEVADILSRKGVSAMVVDPRFLKPLDKKLLERHTDKMPIVTIEDCHSRGGLGGIVDSALAAMKHRGVKHFGWGDNILPHGTISGIKIENGMLPDDIASKLMKWDALKKSKGTR